MTHISLVIAIAENGVIGAHGAIPWRLKSDMLRFKALTTGKPFVMGRKTWESFPKRPLPGRPNLVVTRDANYEALGGEVFGSVEAAVGRGKVLAAALGVDEVMIVGGAEIYKQALAFASRIYLTEVHARPEGDTHFRPDKSDWREVSRERHEAGEKDSSAYSFVVLERKT
jgi:dihydrofolate reductase